MKVRFRLPNKGSADKPRYDQHSPIYIRFGSALTPSGYLVDKDHWQIPKPPTKIDKRKATSKNNPRLKRPNAEQGFKSGYEPTILTPSEIKNGFKALSDSTLSAITTHILVEDQKTPKNVKRNSKWLKSVMNDFHNKKDGEDDNANFHTILKKHLDKVDDKKDFYRREQHPILTRFLDYEKSIDKVLPNEEIDAEFSDSYGKWRLQNGGMPSYIKLELRLFKNALKLASRLEYKTYPNDWVYPKDKNKPKPVTLNWDEIDDLYNYKCESKSLENIRATLIISCYSALRYSDVYKIKDKLINQDRLEIEVKKTGGKVLLPIHSRVKEILKEVDVYEVSLEYFDKKVKEVCRLAGITKEVEGRKTGKEGKGIEKVILPKYKFMSSHSGRRSFCTNHYGELPTPFIMACSGHTTEAMFRRYIGEVEGKHVDKFHDFWERLDRERGTK